MESIGALIEGEWSSISGIYNITEESDFMAHLINNFSVISNDHQIGVDSCWSNKDESTMDMSSLHNFSNVYNGYNSGGTTSNFFPGFRHENGYFDSDSHQILGAIDESMAMGLYLEDEKIMGKSVHISETTYTDDTIDIDYCMINQEKNDDYCELFEKQSLEDINSVGKSSILKNKKRCLNSNFEKTKRNVKSKKNSNSSSDKNNKEKNVALHKQSSSSCSSEDYSNLSLDMSEGMTSNISTKEPLALNSSGKTRASRGPATDPQSLYARKRRERINERLRVLQNLVPNGTKVDISTMLEEAVQYVKFLQLQIKLLSSEDHWMFAPLAYNGMDIGLDLKINKLNDLRR